MLPTLDSRLRGNDKEYELPSVVISRQVAFAAGHPPVVISRQAAFAAGHPPVVIPDKSHLLLDSESGIHTSR